MLNTQKILGISMAPQKNRRLLVTTTYATLAACVLAILIVPPWGDRTQAAWLLILPIVDLMLSRAVLGKLVKRAIFPYRKVEITSLNLSSKWDSENPDERELAIRNGAHYQAFRAVAAYCLFVWCGVLGLRFLSGPNAALLMLLLVTPLLAMLFTLPQAIILWTEPDVPEEAQSSS